MDGRDGQAHITASCKAKLIYSLTRGAILNTPCPDQTPSVESMQNRARVVVAWLLSSQPCYAAFMSCCLLFGSPSTRLLCFSCTHHKSVQAIPTPVISFFWTMEGPGWRESGYNKEHTSLLLRAHDSSLVFLGACELSTGLLESGISTVPDPY
jgi:hypothetical protein